MKLKGRSVDLKISPNYFRQRSIINCWIRKKCIWKCPWKSKEDENFPFEIYQEPYLGNVAFLQWSSNMLMFIQTFAKPIQVFADYTFGRQYLKFLCKDCHWNIKWLNELNCNWRRNDTQYIFEAMAKMSCGLSAKRAI